MISQYQVPEWGVSALVEMAPGRGAGPELWPSVGEYPCYDAMLYQFMTMDKIRNAAYHAAIAGTCGSRTVLDIGTGRDLNWAIAAAESGAVEVTALEGMESTAKLAAQTLAKSPWRDRINLVNSLSTDYEPRSRAEVCVSELIGCIGGAEGAAVVLADARARLTQPGAVFVPDNCITMAGAVAIRDIIPQLGFSIDSAIYLKRIFAHVRRPFDVRLTIANVRADALVTGAGPVESLYFNDGITINGSEEAILPVVRNGYVDGALLWVRLTCHPDDPVPIDTLNQRTNWAPAYLPAFSSPVRVHAGDTVQVRLSRTISDDGIHPDYELDMAIRTAASTLSGRFVSTHHGTNFGSVPLYRELFNIS